MSHGRPRARRPRDKGLSELPAGNLIPDRADQAGQFLVMFLIVGPGTHVMGRPLMKEQRGAKFGQAFGSMRWGDLGAGAQRPTVSIAIEGQGKVEEGADRGLRRWDIGQLERVVRNFWHRVLH